jgi:2-dehydro-3-deoxyphosphogluconate aldolase/(4S)-4-hydroxy-2-oxoglutarate aldolase
MDPDVSRPPLPAALLDGRVVAVARHLDAGSAPVVGAALSRGGVSVMEITLNEPRAQALRAVGALVRAADTFGGLVGAGTVLTVEAARQAVAEGAAFIVMPHIDGAIVRWCVEHGIPCVPGALTPTEVLAAWQAGASAVKLFPASSVGPGYIAQLRGPFPDIPLVPTGGVSADDAGTWIAAGAVAVGLGGWLVGDGEPAGVEARARSVRAAVDQAAAVRASRAEGSKR